MAAAYPRGGRSALQPLHQILAAFPLALFSAAFVTDIIYLNSLQMMWSNFSIWLITGGLVVGVASAVLGIIDTLLHRGRRRERGSALPWWHGVLTVTVLVLALINAFVHSRDAYESVWPSGVFLSAAVTVLVLFTSWTGIALAGREQGAR